MRVEGEISDVEADRGADVFTMLADGPDSTGAVLAPVSGAPGGDGKRGALACGVRVSIGALSVGEENSAEAAQDRRISSSLFILPRSMRGGGVDWFVGP